MATPEQAAESIIANLEEKTGRTLDQWVCDAAQFGLIQPSTKTRVDVGNALRDQPPAGRLEASCSFNSMVTHKVRIEDPASVDSELTGWLRRAYDES